MIWTINYMEVYCEGQLVRRLSVHNISLKRREEQYKALMQEIQQVAKLSDKIYYVDLKVE